MTDALDLARRVVAGLRVHETDQYTLDRPGFEDLDDVFAWLRRTAWERDGDQDRRTTAKRLLFARWRLRTVYETRGGRRS